ncbi:MAG: helix-turn-helix domain-containing protein [Treponema sp.]|nr:helix-turn-helix domain-containing protein [Treponema sp.]
MYKTLVIDDEKAVHTVIRRLGKWQELGLEEPRSAWNGREGLSMMREIHPDIVFVDMNMPVMDGSSFLQKAAEEFPLVKLIVVSGYDDFRYAKTALQANALDYLLKPLAADELNRVLEHAADLLDKEHGVVRKITNTEHSYTADELPVAIKEYLDQKYMEEVTLDSLSEHFYFTKEYLSRLFKKEFGCGIYEYVLQVRMNRAKQLLKDPSVQIQQIAEQLGYNDSNYFSKAFRTYTGISPTDYRTEKTS